MSAKSLLYQPSPVLREPPECGAPRQEVVIRMRKDGRVYTMTIRDKTVVEDPYLVMVKAAAFAIREDEPNMAMGVPRVVRDVYLKNSVTI
mgnify:FL=1